MMLTSQPIKEGAAKKLGLVDAVVPKEKLLPAARQLALAIAAGKAPRSQTLYRTDKLESLGEALAIIDFAKAQAAKKGAHLTHPQLCLDAIRWGVEFGGLKGIDKVWRLGLNCLSLCVLCSLMAVLTLFGKGSQDLLASVNRIMHQCTTLQAGASMSLTFLIFEQRHFDPDIGCGDCSAAIQHNAALHCSRTLTVSNTSTSSLLASAVP